MYSKSSISNLRFMRYARKSTDREDKQVQSLPDQTAILERVAKRDELTVVWEGEEARSAKKPDNRPLFTQMLQRIERGEGDAILCWHVNRLVRNRKEAGWLEQLVADDKISCIKTPERTYWSDDNGIYLALETAQAAQYSRDLSRDVRRGSKEKANRGEWPFRPKLGYRVEPLTRHVTARKRDFGLLKRAWAMLLTESYSVPQVGDALTSWGFLVDGLRHDDDTPRERKPISRSALYRIFRDPFYMGYFLHEGVLKRGQHPQMVTAAEFEKVQRYLSRGEPVHKQRLSFAYSGMIRCGTCGCHITAEQKVKRYPTTGNSKTYTYYHCTGRRGCKQVSVSDDYLDGALLDLFPYCRIEAEMFLWAADELNRTIETIPKALSELDGVHRAELASATKKLNTLLEMREEGEISAVEFRTRRARYDQRINALTLSLEVQASRRPMIVSQVQQKLRDAPSVFALFSENSLEGKRARAKLVTDSLVLTLENGSPNLNVSLDPLFDRIRMFELKTTKGQQIGPNSSGINSPRWRAFRDTIFTLVEDLCERSNSGNDENSASSVPRASAR